MSNIEKKESMRSVAEMREVRKLETLLRKSEIFVASFWRRLDARSTTAACRRRRAWSCGEREAMLAVLFKFKFSIALTGAVGVRGLVVAVWPGNGPAGDRGAGAGSRAVSCPPKLRVETDCAL